MLAAEGFRYLSQGANDSVADFVRCLERTFHVAYGRDCMSLETRETFLHSHLQEGLCYNLKSLAVSGAQMYKELCLAVKNEEKRQLELQWRQQYHKQPSQVATHAPPRPSDQNKPPSHTAGDKPRTC